jgi:RNA polymerase sigma factor (sigma-70 family)
VSETCLAMRAVCPCPQGRRIRIVPCVIEPSPEELKEFGAADRGLLKRVLGTPIEYFDCPLFSHPCVRSVLFPDCDWGKQSSNLAVVETACLQDQRAELENSKDSLLFMRLNYARLMQGQILASSPDEQLPLDELRELLPWAREELKARGRIAEANLSLVIAMARRSAIGGVDFNELLSEGHLTLMRCIGKFDPLRGFKFSTYVCRAMLKTFSQVAFRHRRYRSRFGTAYDPALDRGEGPDTRLMEDEAQSLRELRQILQTNQACLTAAEERVIRARFLIDHQAGSAAPTLQQLGEVIGVTKERVRQIENRALAKLRQSLKTKLN